MKNILILAFALATSSSLYAADNSLLTIHFKKDPNVKGTCYNCDCCMKKTGVVLNFPKKPSDEELIERINQMLPHIKATSILSTEDETIALIRSKLSPVYLAYFVDQNESIDDLPRTVGLNMAKRRNGHKLLEDIKKKLPHYFGLTLGCIEYNYKTRDPEENVDPIATPGNKPIPEGAIVAYVDVCRYAQKDYVLDEPAGQFIKGDT